jgi:thioredoxin-like negative regulator of GroEL
VDKDEALKLHSAARKAYSRGDFSEALHLLDIIDAAFPGNASVLHNRAQCLIGLGRNDEARRLCDYLVATLNHAPAEELKGQIKD